MERRDLPRGYNQSIQPYSAGGTPPPLTPILADSAVFAFLFSWARTWLKPTNLSQFNSMRFLLDFMPAYICDIVPIVNVCHFGCAIRNSTMQAVQKIDT